MPIARGPAPHFQLLLPADEELVAATPMLDWVSVAAPQGGAPLKGLDMFKAVRAFLGRCSLSHEPADQTIFLQTPFLQFDLTDAAWDRIIGEYVASELPQLLEDEGVRSLSKFDDVVNKLTPVNPDCWIIKGPDILLRESFDIAGIPAVPAQGRGAARQGGVPAVPGVPGPPELAFLNICSIAHLEDGGSASNPLLPLARLAGMLGPFSTRDKRQEAVSSIQLTGALIRQQLTSRFGCTADGAMAINLKDFIIDTYLPSAFAAFRASEEELRREARDACTYRRSTQGRLDVEISRISYLRYTCVLLTRSSTPISLTCDSPSLLALRPSLSSAPSRARENLFPALCGPMRAPLWLRPIRVEPHVGVTPLWGF